MAYFICSSCCCRFTYRYSLCSSSARCYCKITSCSICKCICSISICRYCSSSISS
nr:MAG TPA: hypothetical protein [Caudoviricetes sp.]